jgi:hypothetical protein
VILAIRAGRKEIKLLSSAHIEVNRLCILTLLLAG